MQYHVTRSVKQAAAAKLAGCSIDIQHDDRNIGFAKFLLSPSETAEQAITALEAGAQLPGRQLLDAHSELHIEMRRFMTRFTFTKLEAKR